MEAQLKMFLMKNGSSGDYAIVTANSETNAKLLLGSYLHVNWIPCGEVDLWIPGSVDLRTKEVILAIISHPGSMAQLTVPEKANSVPAKSIVTDTFAPSSSWGECHCACHHSGGQMKHCVPCCGECAICRRKITGNIEAHIRDCHPERVHPEPV